MPDGPPVSFSSLPLNKDDEATHLNAWGAYGADDELGFLNRQTDALVAAAAASEIKTGKRIGLDAPMDLQGSKSLFSRKTFSQRIWQKEPRIVHDDEWHFNTQSSTQWDGFRHFGYQKAQRFYNNVTLEDIAGSSDRSKTNQHILGIQNFAKRGIVGRGILVDFASWAAGPGQQTVLKDTNEQGFNPLKRNGITLSWLKATLAHQGTEVKWGDILFVRSGYMKAYLTIDDKTLQSLYETNPPVLSGVEASREMLEWIWNNFSAVAGDQVGFEQLPMEQPFSAHEVLLGGWGCPIGELFDLEELSEHCGQTGRWSFFLSSEVVNVPGGVASPPNAIAIF